ncbi:FAD/NAD(P)-binding domain-containing protein [Apiospora hydei]|uniref:FAD/NAD(P)-binding domain-containing protein n=1 Tax=Apiospora hydei TaxID=1337664 RepID=A0ABR1V534_9PEZI
MGSVSQSSEAPPPLGPFSVSSVAIIGAGPCGLACAKYLLAQKSFKTVTIFERSADVGGVWNYSTAPPTDWATDTGSSALEESGNPMYDQLHTNIPASLMQFSDLALTTPDDRRVFPSRQRVQAYLQDYAAEIRDLIRFSTAVLDVRPDDEITRTPRWHVRSRDLAAATDGASADKAEIYDAVVVASGHYNEPHVPAVPGLREFVAAHPGVVRHSKQYRTPEPHRGHKVLVVGNSASGLDIAGQIHPVCAPPLYLSVQTPTPDEVRQQAAQGGFQFEEVSTIEEFLVAERGVRLRDGTVIADLDTVMFCTGYLFSFPFLQCFINSAADNENKKEVASRGQPLVTDGRKVHGLYKHMIDMRYPTLAFSGLPIKVIPFPVAESQGAVLARLWDNEMGLPPLADMAQWERDEAASRVKTLQQTDDDDPSGPSASAASKGKEPPRWGDEEFWMRSIYAQARMAFVKAGKKATSLEELGFTYQPLGEEKN